MVMALLRMMLEQRRTVAALPRSDHAFAKRLLSLTPPGGRRTSGTPSARPDTETG